MTTETQQVLALALAAAQREAGRAPRTARNKALGYDYVPMEAFIAVAKEVLGRHGLVLVPESEALSVLLPAAAVVVRDVRSGEERTAVQPPLVVLERSFTLVHAESGEHRRLAVAWPVVPDRGRPWDKAKAGTATTSLGYLIRDLLLIERVEPGEEIDQHDPPAEDEHAPEAAAGGRTWVVPAQAARVAANTRQVREAGTPSGGGTPEPAPPVTRTGGEGGSVPPPPPPLPADGPLASLPGARVWADDDGERFVHVPAQPVAPAMGADLAATAAKVVTIAALADDAPAPEVLVRQLQADAIETYYAGGAVTKAAAARALKLTRAAWLAAGVTAERLDRWNKALLAVDAPRGREVRAFVAAVSRFRPKPAGDGLASVALSARTST